MQLNSLFLTDFYKFTVYLAVLYQFDDSQMFYVTGGDSLGEVIKMKFEMTEGVEEVKEIEMSWDPDLKDQNIITKITDSYEGGDHCIKDSDEEISRKRREEGRIRHGDETDNENSQGILDACSYDMILVEYG